MIKSGEAQPQIRPRLFTFDCFFSGSYLVPVDVMLCYVHVAYVHMRRSTLLVWHSRASFGLDLLLSTPHFNLL
jgi:hypothetical protein